MKTISKKHTKAKANKKLTLQKALTEDFIWWKISCIFGLNKVTIEDVGSSESIYKNENVENGDFGLVEESFDENLERGDALVHESSENLSAHPNLVENGLTKPEIEPITKVEQVSFVGVKMAEFEKLRLQESPSVG